MSAKPSTWFEKYFYDFLNDSEEESTIRNVYLETIDILSIRDSDETNGAKIYPLLPKYFVSVHFFKASSFAPLVRRTVKKVRRHLTLLT